MMEHPFIIGTAGHIDHGKTSLVKAITGMDCDRLDEEKRRGITIELGFAHFNLPSGRTVSIVDVPGHERFIRQMAAGASGIDAVMLIIAATEGVMPQTREHLDILNLLGVKSGLVVLTKKDLTDDETVEIARAEAADLIRGTCLSEAAIIPVSSVSGEGLDLLVNEMESLLDRTPARKSLGAFCLPIDRVFSKKGFGSIVTGTVYQGSLAEGDEVQIMPAGAAARVRSLQSHGAKSASVHAGQRAAINLSAVSQEEMERGDMVCAKGAFIPTDCMSAWIEMLPSAREGLSHWQRVRLHVGTVDVVARISLLRLNAAGKDKGYPPGSGGPVQILTESKITVAAGQRFVIRFYSPLVTIGGGRILLPNACPARNKANRTARAAALSDLAGDFHPASFLAAIIHDRGIIDAGGLFELSQMEKKVFNVVLSGLLQETEKYKFLEFGKARVFISDAAFAAVALTTGKILEKFHLEYGELAGLEGEKLYAAMDSAGNTGKVTGDDFKELLGIMAGKKIIATVVMQEKTIYRCVDFTQSLDAKFTALTEKVIKEVAAAGFNLLTLPELEEKLGASSADIKRAAAYLRERDELRMIKDGLLFSREMKEKLLDVLASMKGDITVASLRDVIGVSRKYTLPMLEFLDSQGLTQRIGDKRVLSRGIKA